MCIADFFFLFLLCENLCSMNIFTFKVKILSENVFPPPPPLLNKFKEHWLLLASICKKVLKIPRNKEQGTWWAGQV